MSVHFLNTVHFENLNLKRTVLMDLSASQMRPLSEDRPFSVCESIWISEGPILHDFSISNIRPLPKNRPFCMWNWYLESMKARLLSKSRSLLQDRPVSQFFGPPFPYQRLAYFWKSGSIGGNGDMPFIIGVDEFLFWVVERGGGR